MNINPPGQQEKKSPPQQCHDSPKALENKYKADEPFVPFLTDTSN